MDIEFIESRLTEKITVEALARNAFFSKTHYQRLFHAMVGEPVMEYIKKRRLQLAMRELSETKKSILEIALKYGYESHEGFTRAFKNYFGTTPSRFRKTGIVKEEIKMSKISKESTVRIKKNLSEICEVLKKSVKQTADIAETMASAANSGEGATLSVCAGEVKNLSLRMNDLNNAMAKCAAGKEMKLEIYTEILRYIQGLDDTAFQLRLLRFLSGVETARAGKIKNTAIQKQFTALTENYEKNHGSILGLIKEIIALIQADIKNDASSLLTEAEGLLENAHAKGHALTEELKAAAAPLKDNLGIIYTANRISEKISIINAEAVKGNTEANMKDIQETAFFINLAAYDITIEAARNGNDKKTFECSEELKNYAWQLNKLSATCQDRINESERLIKMLEANNREAAFCEKLLDDVVYYGQLFAFQTELEAERADNDVFRSLAKRAAADLPALNHESALPDYRENVLLLAHDYRSEASALGDKGGVFEFIASEYDLFAEKIKTLS